MLWVILGLIIGLIAGIVTAKESWMDFGEGVFITVMITLLGAVIGCLVLICSSAIAECGADKTHYVVEDTEIYALQDNLATEGNFFLGSGHIDEELKYFYVKQTDLGYTVCNVDADRTYIQYTTGRCHVEKRSYTFNNWFVSLIAIPMKDQYIFYIPDGSIINNYAVDLE